MLFELGRMFEAGTTVYGFEIAWNLLRLPTCCAAIILVVIQIPFLYAFARFLSQRQPATWQTKANIWLSVVVVVLALPILHLISFGAPIRVAQAQTRLSTTHEELDSSEQPTLVSDTIDESTNFADFEPTLAEVGLEVDVSYANDGKVVPTEIDHIDSDKIANELKTKGSPAAQQNAQTAGSWYFTWWFIIGVYVAMALCIAGRNLLGVFRLRSMIRRGKCLSGQYTTFFEKVNSQLQSSRLAEVVACDDLGGPLVCGLFQPKILVPSDFCDWSNQEQEIVLSHEFAHVKRKDLTGEFLSRLLTVLFWLHPVAWMISRRLRNARELATDELVLNTGVAPADYARCLVSVMERSGRKIALKGRSLPAIAMVSTASTEKRIKAILEVTSPPAGTRLRTVAVVAMLLAIAAFSSVRLQFISTNFAQEDTAKEVTATQLDDTADETAQLLDTEDEGVYRVDTAHLNSRVSLIKCIQNCRVRTIEGDEHGPIFNVGGQIVLPDGSPAVGATVIIRESQQLRVSSQSQLLSTEERNVLAVSDVFGKTQTDAKGNFEFKDVKSPALPEMYRDYWAWDILAVSEEFVGRVDLDRSRAPMKSVADLKIKLNPTTTIEGKVVDDQGLVQPDAIVQISSSSKPGANRTRTFGGERETMFWMSAVATHAKVGEDGAFQFSGLPLGQVASLSASHPDFMGGMRFVATSEGVPLGENKDPSIRPPFRQSVVASPASISLEAAKLLRGKVSHAGQPVPD
ncbi:MAG: M56 family metallopeptidase, partial [Planctomycetota bacterium]